MEWFIQHIFKDLPWGLGIAMVVFLAILLIIWLLLPLWVLFIQWNTGKIKDEIHHLVELLETKEKNEKKKSLFQPKDSGDRPRLDPVGLARPLPGASENSCLSEEPRDLGGSAKDPSGEGSGADGQKTAGRK
jgi:hypothetical protein